MIKLRISRAIFANRISIANFSIIVDKFIENWNNSSNPRTKYPPSMLDNPKYNPVVRKHLRAAGYLTDFSSIDKQIENSLKAQKIFFNGRPNGNIEQNIYYYQGIYFYKAEMFTLFLMKNNFA